jgi:hypothetical protein
MTANNIWELTGRLKDNYFICRFCPYDKELLIDRMTANRYQLTCTADASYFNPYTVRF